MKAGLVPTVNLNPFSSEKVIHNYKNALSIWKGGYAGDPSLFYNDEVCAAVFDQKMKSVSYYICPRCKVKVLTSSDKRQSGCPYSKRCWHFSELNDKDPGDVPIELSDLTFIEEQHISRVHPIISVFKLKGHQYGYKGNAISFSQNVQEIASQLPHRVEDLHHVICVQFENNEKKSYDFHVRADKVHQALVWLKKNNIYYKDIAINEENISVLPDDGSVIDKIQCLTSNGSSSKPTEPPLAS